MALNYYEYIARRLIAENKPTTRIITPPRVDIRGLANTTPSVQPMSYADTPAGQQAQILDNILYRIHAPLEEVSPVINPDMAFAMTEAQNAGIQPSADTQALQTAINKNTETITQIESARLERATRQKNVASVVRIGSTILGGLEMNDYADEVAATKEQYETQKKIIDTNIQNSEALLMEKYQENMADLDSIAAAKNIDPTSGAIQGIKEKGAMDMGKDFAIQRSNAEIQKLALDLDYARSNRIAQRQRKNYWQNAAWDVASTGISYFI